MSIQARFNSADPRLYSPDRDVAHAFKPIVTEVAARIEDERWPIVTEVLTHYNVSPEEMGRACQAFCTFVMESTSRQESMHACLHRSGWFDVPEAAQLAYMALLGTVVSGYFFAGVREARVTGHDPVLTGEDLREHGRRACLALTIPSWRRKLTGWWYRALQALRTLRGTT